MTRSEPPQGLAHHRSCTDVLCLLIWAAFMLGWAAVAAFAFWRGNPAQLLHAADSEGRLCGVSGQTPDLSDRPYLHYFDITQCGNVRGAMASCPTPQVCVQECPKKTYNFEKYKTGNCPSNVTNHFVCQAGTDMNQSCSKLLESQCARYVVKSAAVLGRCIPNIGESDVSDGMVKDQDGTPFLDVEKLRNGAQNVGHLTNLNGIGMDAFSDLQNSWWVIVAACVVAMLLSLLWIVLLRFLAAALIWISFLGAVGAVIYGCVRTYMRYDELKSVTGSDASFNPLDAFTKGFDSFLDLQVTWLVFFVVLCLVAVLLLLVLLVLYKRIRIATAVISQASRAVTSSLSTLFFPLLPWLLQLGVLALFISVALYVASMAEASYKMTVPAIGCPGYTQGGDCTPEQAAEDCPSGECRFTGYNRHRARPYLHVYNTVGLFWGLFFCSAFGEMVLAGVFVSWYWTFDKRQDLPTTPLLDSTGRTVRYHLGTLAFGSLIIALIRLARVTLDYISRKSRAHLDNVLARAVICCCKCCLWCLEKFMRFINRNAYIECAMRGTNFCTSAKNAFFLLMRNIMRVVVVDGTCDMMLLLGNLVVTALVTIASFYFIEDRIPIEGLDKFVPNTQHSWVSIATIAVAAFFVSRVFFSVYDMAVDTIFLCILEDLDRNDGSPAKPYYMSKGMMKVFGKKNKRSKRE